MVRYGVPYMGSKNQIAGWVVANLPPKTPALPTAEGRGKTHYINRINSLPPSVNLQKKIKK